MAEMRFYLVREVAEMLQITRHGAYALINSGQLKAVRFTKRRTRVTEEDFNEFVRKHKVVFGASQLVQRRSKVA